MNIVALKGRLSKEPSLKYTQNGLSVCSISIAVERTVKKDSEKKVDFITCNAWGKRAEFISKYFSKGQPIAITGSIQNRSWDDENRQRHYSTEVLIDTAEFAGEAPHKRSDADESNVNEEGFYPQGEDDVLPF